MTGPADGILLPHHAELLERSAVDLDVAHRAGVQSITATTDLPEHLRQADAPGLLFTWRTLDGDQVPQYRPDNPPEIDGRPLKYLFPKGETAALGVHPDMAPLVGISKVMIIEGTKQYLAAVSHAPDDCLVVGIAGCWGWSDDGVPHPDLARLVPEGADVVVIFDADITGNRNVWDAADRLRHAVETLDATTRFAAIPGSKTAGLDDWLATIPAERRSKVLAKLIADAKKLGRAPKRTPPAPEPGSSETYFDSNGLKAVSLVTALRASGHYALGRDGAVWVYRDGVYQRDDLALVDITRRHLGEQWRRFHHDTCLQLLAAELGNEGLRLGDEPITDGLVNVHNGMLDVNTLQLHPHDPKHLSFAQLPVRWNPEATCPRFDKWLTERVGNQADDILEACGLMLDPSVGQRKVPFFIGPTRSGKGTLLRRVEAVAGPYVAAVTLHQLAENRFLGETVRKVVERRRRPVRRPYRGPVSLQRDHRRRPHQRRAQIWATVRVPQPGAHRVQRQ